MKKFFTVLAIFALVLAGCDNGNPPDNENNNNSGNNKTTLTIKNLSDYSLKISYGIVDFGLMNRGGEISKEVDDGIRYLEIVIHIDYSYGYAECHVRVKEAINCEEGKTTQFTITNNTIVTLPGGVKFEEAKGDETGNLKDVIETLSSYYNENS